MARTLRMHKVRTVALRTDKHAVEKKWCRRDCTVRSPTAPLELRWRSHSSVDGRFFGVHTAPLRRFNRQITHLNNSQGHSIHKLDVDN